MSNKTVERIMTDSLKEQLTKHKAKVHGYDVRRFVVDPIPMLDPSRRLGKAICAWRDAWGPEYMELIDPYGVAFRALAESVLGKEVKL